MTEKASGEPETPCAFPFICNEIKYFSCSTDAGNGKVAKKPWCSTKTDIFGYHISGEGLYGDCPENCKVQNNIDITNYLATENFLLNPHLRKYIESGTTLTKNEG